MDCSAPRQIVLTDSVGNQPIDISKGFYLMVLQMKDNVIFHILDDDLRPYDFTEKSSIGARKHKGSLNVVSPNLLRNVNIEERMAFACDILSALTGMAFVTLKRGVLDVDNNRVFRAFRMISDNSAHCSDAVYFKFCP